MHKYLPIPQADFPSQLPFIPEEEVLDIEWQIYNDAESPVSQISLQKMAATERCGITSLSLNTAQYGIS